MRRGPALVRGAVAEAALDGVQSADSYRATVGLQVTTPSAWIRTAPADGAARLGQLLHGEQFEALEAAGAFAYGRAARDGCVGWTARAALAEPRRPTHRVQAMRAFAYAAPDLAAEPAGPFALNALMSIDAGRGRFLHDPAAGWLVESDLAPIGQGLEADPVGVALRLLGAPYLEGARDGVGVDAVGLVQQALFACGLAGPRSCAALAELGRPITPENGARGDLAVWPDHAGLLLDADILLHADPHAASVRLEPLAATTAHFGGREPTLRRF